MMADLNWTSEGSVASDTFSQLPPLVIWTSRRSAVCPPSPNPPSQCNPYTALHHAHPISGNQVVTTEAPFGCYALQHTSFSPWNTPLATGNVLLGHSRLDVTYQFRHPRPECQRMQNTNSGEISESAVENPCSNDQTPPINIDQSLQHSDIQTVNCSVSVSDHYTGHGHGAYDSKEGNYSTTSSDVDHHNIGHVQVSPLLPIVSEDAEHEDRQTLNNQCTSESCCEEGSQLLVDFPQDHTSLSKDPGVSLDRQHDTCDRAHLHSGEDLHKCKHCDQSFSTQSRLTSHERYHVVSHGRVHSGEKPFTCKYCARAFRVKCSLTVHERIHTGERPYKCDHCDEGFKTSGALRIHLRKHTGQKPFQCKVCSKAYRQSSHLTKHQRIHTGEMPHKCEECGKSYRETSLLTSHQRIHTGERPYKCNFCDKAFRHKSSLTDHERIHTGEKPFKCKICGKFFSRRFSLTVHERIHS
ncbi:zinc finger protein 271-like [Sycon ciliatum]|uniref:zinc finger protein 271-like n=1 Tax=Sycon ciliatum TaxID=27933 RepID=UPI0031F621E6